MSQKLLACIGVVAFVASAATANAADLARRSTMPTKAPAYLAPVFTWTGFYLGLNAGYGWGIANASGPVFGSTGDFNVKGAMIGGTIGYNLQTGPWVWGLEGDVDFSDMKGGIGCPGCGVDNRWFATARGRIGYAMGRVLPYLTGGAAFGDIRINDPVLSGSSDTKVGWTVGAGVEYAFLPNWSAKAEYLYADLGSTSCGAAACIFGPLDVSLKAHIFRAGVNYHF